MLLVACYAVTTASPYASPVTRRSFLAALAGLVGLGAWWAGQTRPSADGPAEVPATSGLDVVRQATDTTLATEPPSLETPVIEVISRSGWGAAPPTGQGVRHTIERLTIHHTAGSQSAISLVPQRIRDYQAAHMGNDWPDIAYHFLIDRDGNVYEGRSIDLAGDTSTDYDPTGHFVPAMEGDFSVERPSATQVNSLVALLAWAGQEFGVSADEVRGHRDFASTACPGDLAYGMLDEIRVRVKQLMGDVSLRVLSDQESLDRVAAVER